MDVTQASARPMAHRGCMVLLGAIGMLGCPAEFNPTLGDSTSDGSTSGSTPGPSSSSPSNTTQDSTTGSDATTEADAESSSSSSSTTSTTPETSSSESGSPPTCGDGTIEPMLEQCDGNDLGGLTCSAMGYALGIVTCTSECVVDFSDCSTCGDGPITGPEVCDGGDLGGEDCEALGYFDGDLACNEAGRCRQEPPTARSPCIPPAWIQ